MMNSIPGQTKKGNGTTLISSDILYLTYVRLIDNGPALTPPGGATENSSSPDEKLVTVDSEDGSISQGFCDPDEIRSFDNLRPSNYLIGI